MADVAGSSNNLLMGMTRRPAVTVALLLMIGIGLHDHLPFHPLLLLVVSAMIVLIAAITMRYRFAASACLAVLVTLVGIGLAQREHFQYPSTEIGLFAADEPQLAEIEIYVLDEPQILTAAAAGQRPMPPKQVVTGDVRKIKTDAGWVDASGRMSIAIEQPNPSLNAGQTVCMLGMLERPRPALNPGEFDWAAYYRQQRILTTFTVNRIGNVHVLVDPGVPVLAWIRSRAHHLMGAGFKQNHEAQLALLDALVLGDRDPKLREVEQDFQATGMGYQLNVSGMHIALLACVVFWICRFFRLPPTRTLAITTGFVVSYALISLPSHSGIRSAILCVVVAVALLTSRSTDRLSLAAIAVIGMLIWHPMDLYSVGFQLSFAVILVFAILQPRLQEWLDTWRDPDVVANPDLAKRTFVRRIKAWVIFSIQYGLLAWLATLPLSVYHFGAGTLWSVLGSLLLFPFAIASLFAGVLKILFTLFWAKLSWIFALAAAWPVEAMQWGVHQLARLPGSSVALPAPPIWLIVVYYLLLLAPLLPWWTWLSGHRRWIVRLAPALGVAAILSLPAWQSATTQSLQGLKLTLLSVGAGQCAVVETPGGHTVLVDAGSTTVTDVAKKILEPFLRAERVSHVDEIFLSHGDFDHISAAGEIAEGYSPHEVFTSYHFLKNSVGNVPDLELLDELGKLKLPPKDVATGDEFDIGGGVIVDVLWPPSTGNLNSNNAGLVLRLKFAGKSILFPADIQDPAFTGVLKNAKALKSDVLVAPHHGSSEDLTPAFLAAVHPDFIVSSNANRLSGKQKTFNRMVGSTPLYRTSDCGAITVTIDSNGKVAISTFKKDRR